MLFNYHSVNWDKNDVFKTKKHQCCRCYQICKENEGFTITVHENETGKEKQCYVCNSCIGDVLNNMEKTSYYD